MGAVAVFKEGVVDLVELLNGALLVAEDLDDLLAGHRLLNIALGFGNGLLLAQEEFGAAAADALGDRNHQNDAEDQHERQPEAEVANTPSTIAPDWMKAGMASDTSWRSVSISLV